MHRSSMFQILLDQSRSKGAYLYDVRRDELVLDLFGQFSSLVLGYNHPIFDTDEFKTELLGATGVKITNCEMATPEGERFLSDFSTHPSMSPFEHFHFACTGALAIETATKTAIDYRGSREPIVITFKESFHGINGYGGILTDRFGGANQRLEGFPGGYWGRPMDNPVIRYRDGEAVVDNELTDRVLEEIRGAMRNDEDRNICAVLLEPIQCTAGDQYFDPRFPKGLREICTEFDVPLIFDEVQSGFGGTGTLWYFEQCGVIPDIVAFGKKTQTSGIMVREPFGKIFDRSVRLEVTWDGDLLDMIRCRYILRAFREFNILENVRTCGVYINEYLSDLPLIKNVRNSGLLIAFDFESKAERDEYAKGMRERRVIVLPSQEQTIRWRPHLAFSIEDADVAINSSRAALRALSYKQEQVG